MKKLFVEDVKVGISKGGMACGPVPGNVVAEVCIRDEQDGSVKYYSMAEVEGIPNLFETEVSTFDRQIADDTDDEEFWKMLSEHNVEAFDSYWDFYTMQEEMKVSDPEHLLIWKLLICLVRSDCDETERLKSISIGKCLGDFEIPVCDEEQEYLDEQDEEEEEDMDVLTLDRMLEKINEEFVGTRADFSGFVGMDEEETHEGMYTSYASIEEGSNDYKMTYSIWVEFDDTISSIDMPLIEKKVDGQYVPVPEGEVSVRKIYEVLREEMIGWIG